MDQAAWAEELARKLLEDPLPRRWAHTRGVAARARSLAPVLGEDADLLEASAWLHDIGYSPELVDTGFHPLDGARYLRNAHQADDMLCRLVAHHSGALIEADERGLADVLADEFEPADWSLSCALTFSDMTTNPEGEPTSIDERLAEIHNRYGDGHLVSRAIRRSAPLLIEAVRTVNGGTPEVESGICDRSGTLALV